MSHYLYKIINFEIIDEYIIRVVFDDGFSQTINFKPVLSGKMWGPLQDLKLFHQVSVDPVSHTLTWPNGADFDPETLYNWNDCVDELSARAQQWEQVKV